MFKKGILPKDSGILIPKTKDGRLLFIINYLGHPMVGTTDEKCDVTHYCEPTEEEISFMFKELEPYFGEDYDFKENLVSAWAGIRPLVKEASAKNAHDIAVDEQIKSKMGVKDHISDFMANRLRWVAFKMNSGKAKKSSDTARLSRSHVIEVSESGLVSLMGGKWTSFRHMGEETVDTILSANPDKFEPLHDKTQTLNFNFIGSYSKVEALEGLILEPKLLFSQYQDHLVFTRDLPKDVAEHLIHTYGTSALRVVELGEINQKNKGLGTNERIHPDYPFLKSEIAYASKNEMAVKPTDVLCRRVPIAFLNKDIAH